MATEDPNVLKAIIHPLGLPQRVNTMMEMVSLLTRLHKGRTPANYEELRALPGVGDYIASAVCTFAFGQPIILVDTNTVRIIGRIYGITTDAESRRKRPIRDLHQQLLDRERPRQYNLALLDLGAIICTPRNPQCAGCPINDLCTYPRNKRIRP